MGTKVRRFGTTDGRVVPSGQDMEGIEVRMFGGTMYRSDFDEVAHCGFAYF
jgi:hypothetical protein